MQPEPTPPTRRRWFRFGLRSLLVFTALVGLLMGWIVKQRQQSAREMGFLQEHEAHWGYCVPLVPEGMSEASWWGRCCKFALGPRVDNLCTTSWDDLSPVTEWRHLNFLRIDGGEFTTLQPLSNHWRLEELHLYHAPIADLTPLAGCRRLKILHLAKTKVTVLTPLSALDALEELNLADTPVRDLTPLVGLKQLRQLDISGTGVTRRQIDELKQALPHCEIEHD